MEDKYKKGFFLGKTIFLMVFLFAFIFSLQINETLAATTGISPPIIETSNVLAGVSQNKSINVSVKKDDNEEAYYKVEKRGDFSEYISGPEELVIPKGKEFAVYQFDINVPEGIAGEYEVYLDFLKTGKAQEDGGSDVSGVGAQVVVTTGATAIVKFAITGEEILDYTVEKLDVSDTEVGQFFYFDYFVDNKGNISWRPDKIEIICQDVLDETKTASLIIEEDLLELSKPGKDKKKVKTEHNLIEGKYIATAKFYYENEIVAELDSQQFSVLAAGTLGQKGEIIGISTNKEEYQPGEKIKLEVLFKNTGDLPAKALLITEITKEDGTIIDLLRGSEMEIDKGEEINFSELVELQEPGKYNFSSYVEYGNKKTASEKLEVLVVDEPKGLQTTSNSIIVLVIVVIIIFIIVIIIKKRKKKGGEKQK